MKLLSKKSSKKILLAWNQFIKSTRNLMGIL